MKSKAIEVAPTISRPSSGKVRIDTSEGASKYFKERFSLFVLKDRDCLWEEKEGR